jgi:xanthine dehydrogenase YagS FAD-binding subunit
MSASTLRIPTEEVVCLKKRFECYAATGEKQIQRDLGGGPSFIVHPSDLAPMFSRSRQRHGRWAGGKEVIPIDKFFTLPSEGNIRRENVLKNDEIITEIYVPSSGFAARSTYLKFRERESLDFALASVAAAVQLSGNTVKDARIVLGGVAPIPWRVPAAEKFLTGKTLNKDVLAEAGKIALSAAQPLEKNAYKVPLAQTLVRRALAKAAGVNA